MEKISIKGMRKRMRKRIKNPFINVEYSSIKILTGSDLSGRKLPFIYTKSTNPGPVIFLTACVHGDEVGGIVVIQEIFKKLKKELLKGEVYAFPIMNPIGFETGSRRITLSDEDLNRCFPGDKEGSLAERIAYIIFTKIKETKPFLVLDLHNDWRKSIPHVLIDPIESTGDKEIYERAKFFGNKLGFPIVLDTVEVEKTFTYNLLKQGIPALTIELGESYVVSEKDVENGVKSIWNVLTELGMVGPINEPFRVLMPDRIKGQILNYSYHPISKTSGIIRFLVKPGDIVLKGQPLARIYNAFGKQLEIIKALEDSLVLGYSDSSVAFPGTPIMAFGNFKE